MSPVACSLSHDSYLLGGVRKNALTRSLLMALDFFNLDI